MGKKEAQAAIEAFKRQEVTRASVYASFCFANFCKAYANGDEVEMAGEGAELDSAIAWLDRLGVDIGGSKKGE